MRKLNYLLFIVTGLLLMAVAAPGQARSLYWQDFLVDATLDAHGTLLVREEQTIVFTGDWNGGERTFAVRPGQDFSFKTMYRKTSDGSLKELEKGNLKYVDNWNWATSDTLRWRSRLPGDPAFANTPITYILEYSLGKILIPQDDGGFLINHDFAFPDRSGEIQKFRLNLQLTTEWQHESFPLSIEQQHIPPGKSVFVKTTLFHSDPSQVQVYQKPVIPVRISGAAIKPAAEWLIWCTSGILIVFVIFLSLTFYRHELKSKRFVKGPAPETIDEDWLNEHIFSLLPETVGATWDKTTDGNEVAAILARLVVEGKLESNLEQMEIPFFGWKIPGLNILQLSLKQPRKNFHGYERKLIDGFFIDGDTTDTKRIRKYYKEKKSTFLPAEKIRAPLKKRVENLTSAAKNRNSYGWLYFVGTALLAFFILLAQLFVHQPELPLTIGGGVFGIFALIVGGINGYTYKCRSDKLITRSILVHLFPVFTIVAFTGLSLLGISTLLTLGLFFLYLMAISTAFYSAKTTDSIKGVELCRNLSAGRAYFLHQLEQDRPAIKDEWFPYLLAFGLGRYVDKWMKRFSDAAAFRSSDTTRFHTASPSSGGYSFSGGGGSFGGAGASGAWAMAATSLGASASSSSSSSGGGGGSSGGGGGGGW